MRYEVVVVPGGLTWTSAAAAARARGGYLASITSRGENEAIWALVQATPDASYKRADGNWFGPWIGAHQPSGTAEPLAGWSWLHGEPWGFTAWYVAGQTEPNDDWATGEDHAHFYSFGQAGPTWADGPDDDPPRIRSYVVEYD